MTSERRPLILVPSAGELATLQPRLIGAAERCHAQLQLCGFGPIAAAARTMQCIGQKRPSRVLLAGIAGTYAEQLEISRAYCFTDVACYGIGAGSGDAHVTAHEMGWRQTLPDTIDSDVLPLRTSDVGCAGQLLTCCSAAANEMEARQRCEKFPHAVAEDMEGFAVAVACQLEGIPLTIVRGISNRAGDRNHANWLIHDALESVAPLAARWLDRSDTLGETPTERADA